MQTRSPVFDDESDHEGDVIATTSAPADVELQHYSAENIAEPPDFDEEDENIEIDVPEASSGSAGAAFNLMNSIIGAGIIGLPYAIKTCGFFLGIVLLFVVTALTDYTVRLIVRMGVNRGLRSYEALAQQAFPKYGAALVSLSMFLFAYGGMVAYLVIIGDTVPEVMKAALGKNSDSILTSRTWIVFLISTFLVLPLSLLRNMASLRWSSVVSVGAVFVILATVLARAPQVAEEQGIHWRNEDAPFSVAKPTALRGLGAFSFAFVCHHSAFIVRNSLRNPTPRRWKLVTRSSLLIAMIASAILALGGYLAFFSHTKSDVLNNFSENDTAINVARALLAGTMVSTYAMEHYVARHATYELAFRAFNRMLPERMPTRHFVGITLLMWGSSTLIAVGNSDLGIVLELTGTVAAASLGYTLPGLVQLKLDGFTRSSWRKHWVPLFLSVFGILVTILGLATVFSSGGD
ncbi:MAG: hypothetical protein MHM6MM_002411 [Cercozoa sp. M6MM]